MQLRVVGNEPREGVHHAVDGRARDPVGMAAPRLDEERRPPQQRPPEPAGDDRGAPAPGLAVAPDAGDREQAGGEQEPRDVREQSEEHEDAERGRVPAARPAEPAVGEHRRHDTEQLELGVHARRPTVNQLEGADREQPGRDDAGRAIPAHPPCEERERSHRAHDRRHPEPELVDPRAGERQANQVVEGWVRVVEPEVVEQVAERIDARPSR